VLPPRGLFASGKFGQYERDVPYATLGRRFRASSGTFWGKRGLDRWRGALHEALEPNGRLMVDRVPALTLLIGDQPPVPELAPQDAQCASLASC
jgi:predicted ATPase